MEWGFSQLINHLYFLILSVQNPGSTILTTHCVQEWREERMKCIPKEMKNSSLFLLTLTFFVVFCCKPMRVSEWDPCPACLPWLSFGIIMVMTTAERQVFSSLSLSLSLTIYLYYHNTCKRSRTFWAREKRGRGTHIPCMLYFVCVPGSNHWKCNWVRKKEQQFYLSLSLFLFKWPERTIKL